MLKSQILEKLHEKHKNLKPEDIENIFSIFIRKITSSLKEGKNIEIRGFGTISKKINRAKYVRNPKTNVRLYKNDSYKIHFKIGKTLHKNLNKLIKDET